MTKTNKLFLRVLVGLFLALFLLSKMGQSTKPVFTDVSSDKWYYTWVTKAAQQGWVSGVGDGRFDPEGSVTFAQFALMLDRALYPDDIDSQPAGAQWWVAGCEVAAKHGLFPITDMAIRDNWPAVANTPIEREQMAQMMYNALVDKGIKLPSYEEYSAASKKIADIADVDNYVAVTTCYTIGLLNGNDNGNFAPRAPMTRAQACVVLCNIYGYVTGDVTGGTTPGQPVDPVDPVQPDVPRPAGAVGGQYDVSAHDVPADTNKDGWITESEVQAVLDQLKIEYPEGSPWGLNTRYPGRPDGQGMGAGTACAGFARMVSDSIFGTLPKYAVSIDKLRIGDVLVNNAAKHANVCIQTYYRASSGAMITSKYLTVNGNSGGTVVWEQQEKYADWPTSITDGVIYSRYPLG